MNSSMTDRCHLNSRLGNPWPPENLLAATQIEDYRENGFMALGSILPEEEVSVLQTECRRLMALYEEVDLLNARVGVRTVDGERQLEKLDPVHDLSPILSSLVQDERILTPLRDIYMDEPLLVKDKLIFKLPGRRGYSMHQDGGSWKVLPFEHLITVMIAVDDATAEQGALEVFVGYHDRLRATAPGTGDLASEELAEIDESRGRTIETRAGDMVVFSALTPHRSGWNRSDRSRMQLYFTYAPAKCGSLYRAHYQHYLRYTGSHRRVEGRRSFI